MTGWNTLAVIVVIVAAAFIVLRRARARRSVPGIVVGGLYASKSDDGTSRISKVLALDDFAVHVRIYRNVFAELPVDIDPSILSLAGIGDPEGVGIGHAPVAKEGWLESHVFLKKEPVTEDELDGYRCYLEAMDGR